MCKGEKKTRGRPENGRKPQAIAWRKAKGRKRERNWLLSKGKKGGNSTGEGARTDRNKEADSAKEWRKKEFHRFLPVDS